LEIGQLVQETKWDDTRHTYKQYGGLISLLFLPREEEKWAKKKVNGDLHTLVPFLFGKRLRHILERDQHF
jgi:hypothetical protein